MRTCAFWVLPVVSMMAILGVGFAQPALAKTCVHKNIQTELIDGMGYCVSSVLPSQGAGTYGPENMVGNSPKSSGAWCEGVHGDGKGEWIEQSFRPALPVRSIIVLNGYQKSNAAFSTNGRVRGVRITTSNGTVVETDLRDVQGEQIVRLPDWEDLSGVRLTILSTYPGSKYTDTCITHIWADIEEMRELEFKQDNQ